MLTENTTDTLRTMIQAFKEINRRPPDFILISSDIFKTVSDEVGKNPVKYRGAVRVGGTGITIQEIEVAQLPGTARVELVLDPSKSQVLGLV